jgi:hypothetical protein
MEPSRQQAYQALIQQLVNCPSGEVTTILNAHREMLDEGLVAVMQHYSETLQQQGKTDAAAFIDFINQQIATFIRLSDTPQEPHSAERQLAYVDLIQQLLNCPSGEEPPILAAHAELVDSGFVLICLHYAEWLEVQNQHQNATWLLNLTVQLAGAIELACSLSSKNSKYDEVQQQAFSRIKRALFLVQLIQSTLDSNGDPCVVNPLIQANLPLMNYELEDELNLWWKGVVKSEDKEQQHALAKALEKLGDLLRVFPFG